MIISIIILSVFLIFEVVFRPRLDVSDENELLLWFNKRRHGRLGRKYIILF